MNNNSPLFYIYLLIGLCALVLTWVHIPSYMGGGIIDANVQFWKDALVNANPASTFLAVDILFLALAVEIWMVLESRRLGIRYVWGYIVVATFIGISFAVPVFLAMREKHLSAEQRNTVVTLKAYDIGILALLGVVTLGTGVWLYLK
ncbi:MAG: DUF2834 domain-containing protein [Pseudomonadota bacterium]|nr:DUF2834 domain-containing protein [Pseudomonadota bacterium]